eukprot:7788336-Prorocentrum_lima.AAC.1
MTSSLVGSEMCIRDRYVSAPLHLSHAPTASAVTANPTQKGKGKCNKFLTCLLYTSDAADDM